jgi:hypothetical protein
MLVCKGNNPLCGWTDNGRFECYCYSPPTDKISRIKEIIEKTDSEWKKWHQGQFVNCAAHDRSLLILIEAMRQIMEIVDEPIGKD